MPLEIWILMMTLFNVFLIVTYLYFRTLHINTSKKFDQAVGGLDSRIKKFENQLFVRTNLNRSRTSDDELDREFRR
jgi:hypothetical protein